MPICKCGQGWSGDVRVTVSAVAADCCVICCSITSTRPVVLHSTQCTVTVRRIQHTVHSVNLHSAPMLPMYWR